MKTAAYHAILKPPNKLYLRIKLHFIDYKRAKTDRKPVYNTEKAFFMPKKKLCKALSYFITKK
ncbi:MAG: hypothetical protein LUD00_05855 [Prevotellaceae bacterium]|nr:hypothetical protein [Prevotellaceae bacterium]